MSKSNLNEVRKCPYCKKDMDKYERFFNKPLREMVRENLPSTISDNTILKWYRCRNCKEEKNFGHNRLYLNGELWLYCNGKWQKAGFKFIFR